MGTVTYKGYAIHAASYQLADSGEWTMKIYIWHDTGDQMKMRSFGAANTFRTKEEAIQHCINFGKQIIDGKSENCTVCDL